MGVGTNIQARAVALHHLDCPWRPADIEQRDGRILRQGNQNPEVGIFRYVVEGSFDAYMLADRRAQGQVHRAGHARPPRRPRDRGHRRQRAVSFAEVKALATGDPLRPREGQRRRRDDPPRASATRLAAQPARAHAHDHGRRSTPARADRDLAAIRRRHRRPCRHARRQVLDDVGDRHAATTRAPPGSCSTGPPPTPAPCPTDAASYALGELGELGGLPSTRPCAPRPPPARPRSSWPSAAYRRHPATLPLDLPARDPQPLVRQLEHRIAALPALAARTGATPAPRRPRPPAPGRPGAAVQARRRARGRTRPLPADRRRHAAAPRQPARPRQRARRPRRRRTPAAARRQLPRRVARHQADRRRRQRPAPPPTPA